ncbi:MAG: hypothetical protein QS748_08150 [Candidatus Endonucleobacter bathymodioli]|uniref:Transposase IS4-like domain-containing protein n=1 Tax=Candidatus Endonucleibacter bathymodioli TaxID=539814 RepID=A0AA90ST47_9GAMM|nr:hypothetical protein [Candidatus Endonucleobacter bathymodioli]
MNEGLITIIDASPIQEVKSGSENNKDGKLTKGPKASWHVKNANSGNKKAIYGFSVHTGVDEYGFIHSQRSTSDNVTDSK